MFMNYYSFTETVLFTRENFLRALTSPFQNIPGNYKKNVYWADT